MKYTKNTSAGIWIKIYFHNSYCKYTLYHDTSSIQLKKLCGYYHTTHQWLSASSGQNNAAKLSCWVKRLSLYLILKNAVNFSLLTLFCYVLSHGFAFSALKWNCQTFYHAFCSLPLMNFITGTSHYSFTAYMITRGGFVTLKFCL